MFKTIKSQRRFAKFMQIAGILFCLFVFFCLNFNFKNKFLIHFFGKRSYGEVLSIEKATRDSPFWVNTDIFFGYNPNNIDNDLNQYSFTKLRQKNEIFKVLFRYSEGERLNLIQSSYAIKSDLDYLNIFVGGYVPITYVENSEIAVLGYRPHWILFCFRELILNFFFVVLPLLLLFRYGSKHDFWEYFRD